MAINQPYYNLHQIESGKYAVQGEFVTADGIDYIGPYHRLPNGQYFSEFRPTTKSVEIFAKVINSNLDVQLYNRQTNQTISRYVTPYPYQPSPTMDDYKLGRIQRFFIQKRNNPFGTIMEIDAAQYNAVNQQNAPGINGVIYNKLIIDWRISGINSNDCQVLNSLEIQRNLFNFPYLDLYLTNLLEFYR